MDIIKKINNTKNFWQIIPTLNEKELEEAIKIAADYYYNEQPIISDEIYDTLVERLMILNPNSSVLKETGAPIKGRRVKLPAWMGSMDKFKTEGEIISWIGKYHSPYLISDKLDGISCLFTKRNNNINLYTRGNGNYGQNITHLLQYINFNFDILEKLDFDIILRGELIMSKKNFEKYEDIMSNARNMVGGIVNSKEKSLNIDYAKDVDFILYEIIEPVYKPSKQMEVLKKWKLNVVYHDIYEDISLEILDDILHERKKKSKYEIDGIIITSDNKYKRNTSGNPPYSFAYKGASESANTEVIEVLWKASKDGYLIPRIHFKKVKLSQADLEYTTGFNASFIEENKIGPGAIIKIVRSGDVIPYVLGIIKPAKISGLPNLDYEWDENHVNIILKNFENNRTVIITRLTKFIKDIGVENMSQGIITKLVDAGYDDIFKIIKMTKDDFLSLEGFQETLANKLYTSLSLQLKKLDILTLMVASNYFGHGFNVKKIKKILNVYPDIINVYRTVDKDLWIDQLSALEGFNTITINKFLDSLPEFIKFYKKIVKIIPINTYEMKNKGNLFKGQVIVFTGFRNKEWQQFIEENGGKVSTSVSRNTTIVVYNDGEENTSKYKQAEKLGIKLISKSKFEKKYFE